MKADDLDIALVDRLRAVEQERDAWRTTAYGYGDDINRLTKERDEAVARLKDYDDRLSAIMPADFKDWHQNSKTEWPMVAAETIKNLRDERDDLAEHERQTHEELGAILGTDTSLLDGAKRLANANGRLREAVAPFATCPCCYGTLSCEESCTYRTDDPYGWGRLTALRAALAIPAKEQECADLAVKLEEMTREHDNYFGAYLRAGHLIDKLRDALGLIAGPMDRNVNIYTVRDIATAALAETEEEAREAWNNRPVDNDLKEA